jgi:hypothetical protein
MAADLAIFVSKRLQRAAAALLCLMALQGLVTLSSCQPEIVPQASAARVHLGDQAPSAAVRS